MSKIKLTAQQMALNSFSLCAGAYGSNISCYIDDVQVQIDHLKGDDTVIEKSDAEKKEIIGGQLDKWVNGVLEVCGGNVSEYIIYDEPLDDESASFDWAAYLGDGYVADVQKAVMMRSACLSDISLARHSRLVRTHPPILTKS